jgi:hypothetical protein
MMAFGVLFYVWLILKLSHVVDISWWWIVLTFVVDVFIQAYIKWGDNLEKRHLNKVINDMVEAVCGLETQVFMLETEVHRSVK